MKWIKFLVALKYLSILRSQVVVAFLGKTACPLPTVVPFPSWSGMTTSWSGVSSWNVCSTVQLLPEVAVSSRDAFHPACRAALLALGWWNWEWQVEWTFRSSINLYLLGKTFRVKHIEVVILHSFFYWHSLCSFFEQFSFLAHYSCACCYLKKARGFHCAEGNDKQKVPNWCSLYFF